MTTITCPRCKEVFHTASPKAVRECPYCGKEFFKVKEIAVDGKKIWPREAN